MSRSALFGCFGLYKSVRPAQRSGLRAQNNALEPIRAARLRTPHNAPAVQRFGFHLDVYTRSWLSFCVRLLGHLFRKPSPQLCQVSIVRKPNDPANIAEHAQPLFLAHLERL